MGRVKPYLLSPCSYSSNFQISDLRSQISDLRFEIYPLVKNRVKRNTTLQQTGHTSPKKRTPEPTQWHFSAAASKFLAMCAHQTPSRTQ